MDSKISVVIPFYKHADWLEEALESVFDQTYNNIEVIVVNDGSKEDLGDVLKKYGEKIIYKEQPNRGAAVARNKGIEIATGTYIAFLDSDDLWVKDKLEKQLALMESSHSLWSCMSYETFGDEKKVVNMNGKVTNHFPQILCSACIATPTVMISADALRKDNSLRFPAHMRKGQDYFLWLKLSLTEDILNINEKGARVRIRNDSTMNMIISQLMVRASIADWVKSLSQNNQVGIITKMGYKCSKVGYSIFTRVEKLIKSKKGKDLIAACLYVIPYLMFKSGVILNSSRKIT